MINFEGANQTHTYNQALGAVAEGGIRTVQRAIKAVEQLIQRGGVERIESGLSLNRQVLDLTLFAKQPDEELEQALRDNEYTAERSANYVLGQLKAIQLGLQRDVILPENGSTRPWQEEPVSRFRGVPVNCTEVDQIRHRITTEGCHAFSAAPCRNMNNIEVADELNYSSSTSIEFKDGTPAMRSDFSAIYKAVRENLFNITSVRVSFGENFFLATGVVLLAIGARLLAIPGSIYSWFARGN